METASPPTLEELLRSVGVPAEGTAEILRWARGRKDEILAAAPEELLRACEPAADGGHLPPPDHARAETPLPQAPVDPVYRPPTDGGPIEGSGGAPAGTAGEVSGEEIEELDDVEILDEDDLELLDEEEDLGGGTPGRPLVPPTEAASAGADVEDRSPAEAMGSEDPPGVNEGTERTRGTRGGGPAAAGGPVVPGSGAGKVEDATDGVEHLDEDPFDEDELDLDLSDV